MCEDPKTGKVTVKGSKGCPKGYIERVVSGGGMNREEYAAWVQAAWEKDALKRTPLAKSIRKGKAQGTALKRGHRAIRRSLAAEHGAKMRSLKKQQAENEDAMRKRWAEIEAAAEKRRWDFLLNR